MHGCGKNYLILIPFRLPQISCFIHILKCFSSDSDNCPDVGIGPLPQFPHPPRAGPVLLTLLIFPPSSLSYQVLHGSIYTFPLVRYTCPLSAGVLDALLCLKVYSWCIHGERCTPRPPTPQPSCSLDWNYFAFWHSVSWGTNKKFGPKPVHLSYSPLEFDYTLGCSQMFWNFSVWKWNL